MIEAMERVRIIDLVKHGDRYDYAIVQVEGDIKMAKRRRMYSDYVLVDRDGNHVMVIDFKKRMNGKAVVTARYYAALHALFTV